MTRRAIMLAAVVCLAACGTDPVVRTVQVEVPIKEPCHAAPVARPTFPHEALVTDSDIFEITKALWASINVYKGYAVELEASVKVCQ